jgi:YVTN family beta-propeller protein
MLTSALAVLVVTLGAMPAPAQDLVLVASNAESSVAIVDAKTLREVARLPTGEGPHEVAVSPDGRLAYVANCGSAGTTVSVLDLVSRTVRARFDLAPHRPHDLTVSGDGSLLFVACAPSRSLLEVNAATGVTQKVWETGQEGGWMVTVSPDSRKLYAANYEGGSVSVIDRASGSVRTISLGAGPMGIDVSPNGRELWVANANANTITVVDVASDRLLATFPSGDKGPVRLRFTADGKRVVVPHDEGKSLVVFDAGKRSIVGRVALPVPPKVVALSGDGRTAYLSSPPAHSALVVDVRTLKVTAQIPVGKTPDGVAWASTGTASRRRAANATRAPGCDFEPDADDSDTGGRPATLHHASLVP